MTPSELQNKIDQLFTEAIALDESERMEFLDRECALLSPHVRQEIEALIKADESFARQTRTFLPAAKVNVAGLLSSSSIPLDKTGERIGPYVVKKKIATGGFGSVYLGVRSDDFRQQVAIKLIRPDHGDNTSILKRFEVERQVLSDLNHPNIARLLDGGSLEDGRPYFVMEFVDGRNITDYCAAHQLDVDDRLRLFQIVCQAVAHAHQFGVVHRDIKRSNILITEDGTPKLLDFGIAKLTDFDSHPVTALTETGQSPMTPDYASPEQLLRTPVGQASDVFSLGVVLYELLTGVRPYRVESGLYHELVEKICNDEPTKPSTAITLAGDAPAARLGIKNLQRKKLKGDVDNIVLMSLRKEPERRYSSASRFGEDIQRYFDGLPVMARRDSVSYRTAKFVRRHRVALVAVTAIVVGISAAWLRSALLARSLRESLYVSQMNLAFGEWQAGNLNRVRGILNAQVPQGSERDLRGFEWRYLDRLYAKNELFSLSFSSPITRSASHVQGQSIAVLVNSRIITIDFKTRSRTTLPGVFANEDERMVRSMTFDDKGETLALVWSCPDFDELEIVHLSTNHTRRATSKSPIVQLDFSPDGNWVATGDDRGNIRIRDVASGDIVWETPENKLTSCSGLEFSPNGSSIAVVEVSGRRAIIWSWNGDALDGAQELSVPLDVELLVGLSFSPDGQRLAVGGSRLSVAILQDDEHQTRVLPFDFVQYVDCLRFSPNGENIALGTSFNFVELRDAETYELVFRRPQGGTVNKVFFSADSQQIASVSNDRINIWDVEESDSSWLATGDGAGMNDTADVSSDNGCIAFADDHDVVLWNLDENTRSKLTGNQQRITDVSFSGTKTGHLGATGHDGRVAIWNLAEGGLHRPPIEFSDDMLASLNLSPAGEVFVVGGYGHVSLWTYEGERLWSDPTPGVWCRAVEFGRNGELMITSGSKTRFPWRDAGYIRVWDVGTRKPRLIDEFDTPRLTTALALSADDSLLAAGDSNNTISLFDLEERKLKFRMYGHASGIASLAFHPDGKRLVSGGWDSDIKIWDLHSGIEIGSVKQEHALSAIRFVANPVRGLGLFISSDENGMRNRIQWFESESVK